MARKQTITNKWWDERYADESEEQYADRLCEAAGIRRENRIYLVPSSSKPTTVYQVRFAGRGDDDEVRLWTCTCPATVTCKHIKLVAAISGAVCDAFGRD